MEIHTEAISVVDSCVYGNDRFTKPHNEVFAISGCTLLKDRSIMTNPVELTEIIRVVRVL
jgi:hypothetical protein